MNKAAYTRTAAISKQFGVIKKAPSGAYRTDLAAKAVAQLKAAGVDVNGQELEAGDRHAHRRRQVGGRPPRTETGGPPRCGPPGLF